MEILSYGHGCMYFVLLLVFFLILDLIPLVWRRLHEAFVSTLIIPAKAVQVPLDK